jgi:hypothetical protein
VAIAVAAYILWSGGLGLALGNFEKWIILIRKLGTSHSIPRCAVPNYRIPTDHRSTRVVSAPQGGGRGPPPRDDSRRTPAVRTRDARRSRLTWSHWKTTRMPTANNTRHGNQGEDAISVGFRAADLQAPTPPIDVCKCDVGDLLGTESETQEDQQKRPVTKVAGPPTFTG